MLVFNLVLALVLVLVTCLSLSSLVLLLVSASLVWSFPARGPRWGQRPLHVAESDCILCYTIRHYVILCDTIVHYINTIPYYHYTIFHDTITILYYTGSATWPKAIVYYAILYDIISYYAILCDTILYDTMLYYTTVLLFALLLVPLVLLSLSLSKAALRAAPTSPVNTRAPRWGSPTTPLVYFTYLF